MSHQCVRDSDGWMLIKLETMSYLCLVHVTTVMIRIKREERCCTNLVPFSCSGRRLCLIWREWRGLCQKGRCICFRLTLRQRRWGCLASRSLARFLPTLLLKPAMQWNQRSYLHMTTLDTFSHINHINHISHSSSTLPFLKSTNTISQIQICATQG